MKNTVLFITLTIVATFGFAQTQASPKSNPKQSINPQSLQKLISLKQQQIRMQKKLLQLQHQELQLQQHLFAKQQNQSSISKQFKWIDYNKGPLPKKLIDAGLSGGKKVYICHAKFQSFGVHPGMYINHGCLISYGGLAYPEKTYALLTGTGKISWKPASSLYNLTRHYYPIEPLEATGITPLNSPPIKSPSKPIIGGHEKGHPLYICRVLFHNKIHVGKVVSNNCNISWKGRELRRGNFEVLFGMTKN